MFLDPGNGKPSKPLTKNEIMDKKMKLKEKFDAEYDEQEGGKSFYDELKAEVNQQAQVFIIVYFTEIPT